MGPTAPARAALLALSVAACGDDGQVSGAAGGGGGEGSTTTTVAATGSGGAATSASSTAATTSGAGAGGGSGGGGPGGAGGGGEGPGGAGGGPACDPGQPVGPLDLDRTLPWDGEERTYRVHLPPGYPAAGPAPVVLMLHGYFMNGDQMETVSQMTPAADEAGVVVVYADGRSPVGELGSWNAGACCGTAVSDGVDDVGFVGAMLDALLAELCLDERRVFAAGFSNGGMLSHRLACELSERIAAIGPVAGTLAVETCTPSRPVPVMHTHGTDDFVVLWDGGGLGASRSVEDTIATWVAQDGCTDAAPTTVYAEGAATCQAYTECAEGAEVRLCTIEGGGHQWPGGESAGPGGTLSDDLQTSEALLAFFLAHPMP